MKIAIIFTLLTLAIVSEFRFVLGRFIKYTPTVGTENSRSYLSTKTEMSPRKNQEEESCGEICKFQRKLLKNIESLDEKSRFNFTLTEYL